jgi:hypothetical protein
LGIVVVSTLISHFPAIPVPKGSVLTAPALRPRLHKLATWLPLLCPVDPDFPWPSMVWRARCLLFSPAHLCRQCPRRSCRPACSRGSRCRMWASRTPSPCLPSISLSGVGSSPGSRGLPSWGDVMNPTPGGFQEDLSILGPGVLAGGGGGGGRRAPWSMILLPRRRLTSLAVGVCKQYWRRVCQCPMVRYGMV